MGAPENENLVQMEDLGEDEEEDRKARERLLGEWGSNQSVVDGFIIPKNNQVTQSFQTPSSKRPSPSSSQSAIPVGSKSVQNLRSATWSTRNEVTTLINKYQSFIATSPKDIQRRTPQSSSAPRQSQKGPAITRSEALRRVLASAKASASTNRGEMNSDGDQGHQKAK